MKFCVIGDSSNKPRYSSHIIVSSLNNAAKNLGLFDDSGVQIKWDALCQTHGDKVDVFISSYEIDFPELIIRNSGNKPILGVSSDNYNFIINGGKLKELAGWFPLGIDSENWQPVPKFKDMERFCVGVYTESLVRGGIELCIESFGKAFSGRKNCVLKIKDRNGTDAFNYYVKQMAGRFNIEIEYINEHWSIDQVKDFLSGIDCQLYLNRSSTWALPPIELLSAGLPSIIIPYSGPKEYCFDGINALCPDFDMRPVSEDIGGLFTVGCRNFFLMEGYKNNPVWAVAKTDSVAEKLLTLKENKYNICQSLSNNGIETTRNFSWEKSVIKLKEQLERWF